MSRNFEVEWGLEQHNLEITLRSINKRISELQVLSLTLRSEIVSFRKHFWDDINVTVDEVSIAQQSLALNSQEKQYIHTQEQLKKWDKIVRSPYFGRLDFVEDETSPASKLYIGTFGFIDEETGQFLVYDWRAPISSLFYDYEPGPASYTSPDQVIEGVISLKRQFIVKEGSLKNMFDTDVHIRDEMLLSRLSERTDEKLRHIVATIQKEQNQIIRNETYRLFMVQGAAGSGKTTAALHRIAFLLYKHRNTMTAENVLFISPNPLFTDYVSNVLPELGEQNVRQMTFMQYKHERLGMYGTLEDFYEQKELLLDASSPVAPKVKEAGVRFKTSSLFVDLVEKYTRLLLQEGMKFRDLHFSEDFIISSRQLSDLFYKEYGSFRLTKRLLLIQDYLKEMFAKQRKQLTRSLYFDRARRPGYIESDEETKKWCLNEIKTAMAPLSDTIKEMNFIHFPDLYLRLFEDDELAGKLVEPCLLPPEWDDIRSFTRSSFEDGRIPFEDTTPFLFLKETLIGFDVFKKVRHVIIDEAQDYSIFDFTCFKNMLPNSKVTLLGDIHQSIHNNADLWDDALIGKVFGEHDIGILRLEKSYRSTMEIVLFASSLLKAKHAIQAFGRKGAKPKMVYIHNVTDDSLARNMVSDMDEMRCDNMNSIAIICRTAKESDKIYHLLRPVLDDLQQITRETESFHGSCVVLPSYCAKGLEFDGVIVTDITQYLASETNLLYTVCTRSLHRLVIYNLTGQQPDIQFDETMVDIVYRDHML